MATAEKNIKVPFLALERTNKKVRQPIIEAFTTILESEWYILGKAVETFEVEYSKFHNVPYCVGVGNGLDALIVSLRTLGVGPGDEVIVPANTFIATALAVAFVGATPILVDPSENTYNITEQGIRSAITTKTKAIIPVHLYGQACEMEGIMKVAAEFDIKVIEDNAQAQGAHANGKMTGTLGHINATSFYPGKNLGAMGDAGAITSSDLELTKKARMYRNYGSSRKYEHEVAGQNTRLDELQAAVLSEKLKHLDGWNSERIAIANRYYESLSGVGDVILPALGKNVTHVYHLFVIRTQYRDQLKDYLEKNGIETLIHYPKPIHLQGAFQNLGHSFGAFPISERLANTSLSLPIYPGLSSEAQSAVIETIVNFYNEKQ